MAKKAELYQELIFKIGDLARERLAASPLAPRSMERVFKAEEVVRERQAELDSIEQRINGEDEAFSRFIAERNEEKAELAATVKRFRKAVDAIDGKVKGLRKKIAEKRAQANEAQVQAEKAEARIRDFEMAGEESKASIARDNLKKLRISTIRSRRELEELEAQLSAAFSLEPDQPGAEGIAAHRRLLEIEDETDERKRAFDALMEQLGPQIATKEEEARAAEEYLDQALYLLGEECYAQRVRHPELVPLYLKVDEVV